MGLLDSITNAFTGGQSDKANQFAQESIDAYKKVNVPGIGDLTIPELQQYQQMGLITPEQVNTALVNSNAYETMPVNETGRTAELGALNQLQNIAKAGGNDAQEKADLENALNSANEATAGRTGAIERSFAAKGIPTSLIAASLENQNAGQNAQTQHLADVNANAAAEQRALAALSGSASIGGNIQSADTQQQQAAANAANSLAEWNSQVANNVGEFNAGNNLTAQTQNVNNAQNTENANVTANNTRTAANSQIPQTIYEDTLQKASGVAGAANNAANQANQAGQNNANFLSGLLNAGITAGATAMGGPAAGAAATTMLSNGGSNNSAYNNESSLPGGSPSLYNKGGVVKAPKEPGVYDRGGRVPGRPMVPGNSPQNDRVPALLSPGEVVIPRTIAPHPTLVKDFVRHLNIKRPSIHPEDVSTVLRALGKLRETGV